MTVDENRIIEFWRGCSPDFDTGQRGREVLIEALIETSNGKKFHGFFNSPGELVRCLTTTPPPGAGFRLLLAAPDPYQAPDQDGQSRADVDTINRLSPGGPQRSQHLFKPISGSLKPVSTDLSTLAENGPKTPENGPDSDGRSSGWKRFALNLANTPAAPIPLLLCGGKIVASAGNFVVVVAPQRAGKTTLLSVLAGVAIGGLQQGPVTAPRPLRVVLADQEQNTADTAGAALRAINLSGRPGATSHELLTVLNMRCSSPLERLATIEEVIRDTRPDLLLIDGLAKLVRDVNNSEEAAVVTEYLGNWCENYGVGIVVTVHMAEQKEQPGGKRGRGHIGGEISKTGAAVMAVHRKGDVVTVSAVDSRYSRFPDFAFIRKDDSISFVPIAPPEPEPDSKPQNTTPPVIAALLQTMEPGQTYKVQELATALAPQGFSLANIQKYLRIGKEDGIFNNPSRGLYCKP